MDLWVNPSGESIEQRHYKWQLCAQCRTNRDEDGSTPSICGYCDDLNAA